MVFNCSIQKLAYTITPEEERDILEDGDVKRFHWKHWFMCDLVMENCFHLLLCAWKLQMHDKDGHCSFCLMKNTFCKD
ncbi:hypothetical protein CEXT_770311 [Caerostris extrusa]|uniref:Uncharacterized protein n=1 Tax=Caerostris extrusa TaxID=172846 RepID=A0AAV4RCW0_CAEEX|nr:hypothetical protein CEXT_770311 [Caerostris extrusa]